MNTSEELCFDSNVVSKEAIMQVISMYKGKADFDLKITNAEKYILTVRPIQQDFLLSNFKQDINDQQVRIDLEKTFGNIRADIVKYAFSPVDCKNE